MPGILAPFQMAKNEFQRERLIAARAPLNVFFEMASEIRAIAFQIQSVSAEVDNARLGCDIIDYLPVPGRKLSDLIADDRFCPAAFRLERHPIIAGISQHCLADRQNGHQRLSGLLATRRFLYWMEDARILYQNGIALGSYPRNPIYPYFASEPTGHQSVQCEAHFTETFPDLDQHISQAWRGIFSRY